ncbi:hypothetical protein C1893_25495 [Pseudomonas sp. MPR-ANC1]|uniref:hypothetical protein n=1 Tax=Pseudomonas sp. MPR-ANC1 TaxID=2075548 RepID=UPI000CD203B7|nr:hypothetical protein [Pseudomonas sp. MPR-ANC1]POA44419.1 hypothetical protein C1893_25495 [Pseudomonas sp. MPR-ANC1]
MSVDKNAVPAITSVKDDQGSEIPNGGATTATSVQLNGLAGAGENVQILDGVVVRGQVVATAAGHWALSLTGLTRAPHSITARGEAGFSPARTFTVIAGK